MNDEFKSRLLKYLDVLEDAGRKGAEFVQDQAPETVRQFVQWEITEHLLCAAALIGGAVIAIVVMRLVWLFTREAMKRETFSDFGPIEGGMCRGTSFVIGTGAICVMLGYAVHHSILATKAYVAPNVFLIEKAAELAKNLQ